MSRQFGVLVAALLLSGTAAPQSQKKPECDVATVEEGQYCSMCKKLLKDSGIKDGKCAIDNTATQKVDVCVKKDYQCGCGGGGCCKISQGSPGKCKCGNPLKIKGEAVRAVVMYKCDICEGTSLTKDGVTHDDEKHKTKTAKTVRKTCELSGTGLHKK